mgnify:CR=1 FL=1
MTQRSDPVPSDNVEKIKNTNTALVLFLALFKKDAHIFMDKDLV